MGFGSPRFHMRTTLTTAGVKPKQVEPSDGLTAFKVTLTPRGTGRPATIHYRSASGSTCLNELKLLFMTGKVDIQHDA